jgi:hypothetical protein
MAKKDDEAEIKQRGLDISNRAREEGTEKTGFFQRLREGNIDDPNSAAYKKYGAGRARLDDQIATAKEKLAGEVQKKVTANKANNGDVSEYDRNTEAAAKTPARSDQGVAKTAPAKKAPVVTKEQLAKSGFDNLRDYMNAQKGLKRRDGKAPERKTAPAVSSSYRSEGANKAKPAAPSGNVASTAPAKKSGSSLSALPMNPSLLRQRDEAEKKRDAARAARRASDEAEKKARPAKEAAERKMLSEQPGAVAYRKKREEEDKMSPGQRSAARGKAVKEFFGMAKGGAVRGAGIAKQGVRKCKMV